MIENFSILTKGGLLIWDFETHPLKGTTINLFIQNILLEKKASFNTENYSFKWTMDNESELIFLV
jgi:signal recognition particle receptor subunit alpha